MKHWCADFTLLSAVVSLKNIIYLSFMAARRLRGEKYSIPRYGKNFFFFGEVCNTFNFFFSFWIVNFTINCVHNKTDETKSSAWSLPWFGNKPSVVGSFCLAHEDFD